MILVTGATGSVGRHVASQLLAESAAVRALVREPEAAGLPVGVEAVRGDLADPTSLDQALSGVDSVFLLWPFFSAEGASAVVEAIARSPRRVVYLSAEAAAEDPESFWAVVERRIEESGLEWTFLRPTGFAKNTLGWADQVRAGAVRGPYGQAARSLIHERDIAAVAVRALTEDGHVGKTYVLTGPATVTHAEQVRIIGEAIGRPVRWEEQSPADARPGLVEIFGDESFADGSLDTWAAFVTQPERVTATVEEVTGLPARSFSQWAVDHAADFRQVATTEEVASEYVSLFREGDLEAPGMKRLFSEDFVRVEQAEVYGPPVEMRGDEIAENIEGFLEDEEIHAVEIEDPFVGGDSSRFAVRFSFDSTFRPDADVSHAGETEGGRAGARAHRTRSACSIRDRAAQVSARSPGFADPASHRAASFIAPDSRRVSGATGCRAIIPAAISVASASARWWAEAASSSARHSFQPSTAGPSTSMIRWTSGSVLAVRNA